MHAFGEKNIEKAYFVSPIVDMEELILNMMKYSSVTEKMLKDKKMIPTAFGEDLSWKYLCYVREHPIKWNTPTHILYGEKDNLTPLATIKDFADKTGASLTVMSGGEHWFHTDEQLDFLKNWIQINIHQPSWWFYIFGQLALTLLAHAQVRLFIDLPVLHFLPATRERVCFVKYT